MNVLIAVDAAPIPNCMDVVSKPSECRHESVRFENKLEKNKKIIKKLYNKNFLYIFAPLILLIIFQWITL
ncbi:MAG: hypothetical protein FWH18_00960 [Marinilabiliaceae bacterium]|nr:hypothetical protein [Marinilabiliaceae bacterium]